MTDLWEFTLPSVPYSWGNRSEAWSILLRHGFECHTLDRTLYQL